MEKLTQNAVVNANAPSWETSFVLGAKRRLIPLFFIAVFFPAAAFLFAGCEADTPKPATQTESKPAGPAIPAEIEDAAKALLGSGAQVLVFGDLAKTGKQQFLAVNVVPNTPNSKVAGLVVTRAIIAENEDGKWMELLHCDEYLKNAKGYLAMTPLSPVTGWKLQFEQSAMLGLQLYFTLLQTATESHGFPIGVRWNAATKRYQSLDRNYEHFLGEAVVLENVRSQLR
jgi:hypothetical protein